MNNDHHDHHDHHDTPKPPDLASIIAEGGNTAPSDDPVIAIERLAAMPPIDYDKARKAEAKLLGIQVGTLDREVSKRRKEIGDANAASIVEELEPWPEAVALPDLLAAFRDTVSRHVILPQGADTAIPLWLVGAFAYFPLRIFPKLFVYSPEKRCGKTTLLEVIDALSPRAILASNISPAVIFRVVEKVRPTIIIDECDTFVARNDELRGIINCGHTRASASVIRCDGDDHEPRKFSTWAPMALASIKLVGDTITDRSVLIPLRRKTNREKVEKPPADLKEWMESLRRKGIRWAKDNEARLVAARPVLPESSNDRALDNWTPLFAIAEMAGGSWPSMARDAFAALTATDEGSESAGHLLLEDVREIFAEMTERFIWTSELVDRLVALEERPWSEWKGGRAITANTLARMLSSFGVKSRQLKYGGTNKRGYHREDFEDAFARYL